MTNKLQEAIDVLRNAIHSSPLYQVDKANILQDINQAEQKIMNSPIRDDEVRYG